MTGEETVAVSPVRAEGQHRSCPRIRRERRPLPPIVVPIVMTMFAVLWLAGLDCAHMAHTHVRIRAVHA